MTARLLIDICGLSQREAAEFLSVHIDTVKSWYRARPNTARAGVIDELRALHAAQRRAAANMIRAIRAAERENGPLGKYEVGLAADDAEARSRGWPCVGAMRQAIGLAAARLGSVRIVIVPRGTTPATALAIMAIMAIEAGQTMNTPRTIPQPD